MATGRVKWFNNAKGWGFIVSEECDSDVFVHFSSIRGAGYRTLNEGQIVHFDTEQGNKGVHAIDVRVAEQEGQTGEAEESQ